MSEITFAEVKRESNKSPWIRPADYTPDAIMMVIVVNTSNEILCLRTDYVNWKFVKYWMHLPPVPR